VLAASIIRAKIRIIALMMQASSTSETSVNFQTTRRYNPEDSHLYIRHRENLKSLFIIPDLP
jgi:hypothetical protein